MEILHKLRWVLYPSIFVLVFIVAAYCTFPSMVLQEMAESSLTQAALSMGPKSRGVPEVSMKDISLWRISGIKIDGLSISWPTKNTEPPIRFEVDDVRGRIGIFSLLSGNKTIHALAELYDGDIDFDIKMRGKDSLSLLYLDASQINLSKMSFIEASLGAPLQGLLNFFIDLNAISEMSKDGSGTIRLNLENASYGPGSIRLPAGGLVSSLSVPKLTLGKLAAELALDKGQLESKTFSLSGGDLEADIKLTVTLGKTPTVSRVNGSGWFSIKREFISSNETVKMLYDLIPELRMAQQTDGKVGLIIRGSLTRPDFRLERYTGAKNDKKDTVATKE